MDNILFEELKYIGKETMPKVLLAAAECAPLAKTGGLADVVGTLPKVLAGLGIDARIVIPYHRIIKEKYAPMVEHITDFYSPFGSGREYVGLERLDLAGTVIYLIDNEKYFGDKIYRGGTPEGEQYSYFCRAVLDAIPCMDFVPDVLHCNDWHTAMLPMLARTQYRGGMQEKLKFLITIHNIAFQGKYDFGYVNYLLGVDIRYYTPEFMELNGCADYLKAACVFSDRINTVSPSYAEEIKTPYYAEGLEGILNARHAQLSGIVNGIDVDVFNPETDPHIAENYSLGDMAGKKACKADLQRRLGLQQNPEAPIFAMVTRMTEQKGFDLVCCVIDELMAKTDMQFVLLGSGDKEFENFMSRAEERWSGRLAAYIGYNDELAHIVYAGSDFYLMPSRFEPCGLSQMIAMRYGTVPVVRETGGLRDTVLPYNKYTGEGTGFSFSNYDAWEMRDVILNALACYRDADIMNGLISSDMSSDFSFFRSAVEYGKLYINLFSDSCNVPLEIEHNAALPEYRLPEGALKTGSSVRLAFKLNNGAIRNPVLIVYDGEGKSEYPMSCDDNLYYAEINVADHPALLKYCFRLETAAGLRWVCKDISGYKSRVTDYEAEGFGLTVYADGFTASKQLSEGVMYRIFPDSFGFEAPMTAKRGAAYHRKMGRRVTLLNNPESVNAAELKDGADNVYFGGTLKGIESRLEYLKNLGVTCIYLDSVFEAPNNHRNNVSDFERVDPMLGTNKGLERLCAAARRLGIKIILGGFFTFTADDSRYFNSKGNYASLGAAQSEDSEYYGWYSFSDYPGSYECWWGLKDCPKLAADNSGLMNYLFNNNNGVFSSWMKAGVSGWELRAADEYSDALLSDIRNKLKEDNTDTAVIGEVWQDAVSNCSYGSCRRYALGKALDSVTNYPLRSALIAFVTGKSDAPVLRDFLVCQRINYPRPLYYSLINLLGSSQVPRIRSVLLPDDMPAYSDEALNTASRLERFCAVLLFALPGMPSIYYGDEQGMQGGEVPFNRLPFIESDDSELHELYRRLSLSRHESEALKYGDARFASFGPDTVAISRETDSEVWLAAVNRGKTAAEINMTKLIPGDTSVYNIEPMSFIFKKIR